MRGKVVGLMVWVACVAGVQAQERRSTPWVSATAGAIPEGAAAHGREADGREQFVCRGAYGGGTHLGKIASGFGGCNIGYGGSEVTLREYEVLVASRRREATADLLSMAATAVAESSRARRTSSAPASVPPSPPEAPPKRGFDEEGEPYVEVQLPDGTIKRSYANRVMLTMPDGTTKETNLSRPTINALPPTPPELPDDPQRGRAWVDEHNGRLLALIRRLVENDEGEMKKFDDAERRASADDVFAQIAHRTRVATFLAQAR